MPLNVKTKRLRQQQQQKKKKKKKKKSRCTSSNRDVAKQSEKDSDSECSSIHNNKDATTPIVSRQVNEEDSSTSSLETQDLKETNGDDDEDTFDQMNTSTSEILNLARQSKLYKNSKQEEICTDAVQCIQRYLRTIYRHVSILFDNHLHYTMPCSNEYIYITSSFVHVG